MLGFGHGDDRAREREGKQGDKEEEVLGAPLIHTRSCRRELVELRELEQRPTMAVATGRRRPRKFAGSPLKFIFFF